MKDTAKIKNKKSFELFGIFSLVFKSKWAINIPFTMIIIKFLVPLAACWLKSKLKGLVQKNSIEKIDDGITTAFIITDNNMSINAKYKGVLPNLFREGQGVVAEGKLNKQGTFVASKIFAKHDENYLPPEIADAIKKEGQWKGN